MVQPVSIQSGRVALQGDPASVGSETRVERPVVPAQGAEVVTLSAEARALPATLKSGPPMDTGRVDALRSAIAEGSYRPDPQKIADSLARSILELSQ